MRPRRLEIEGFSTFRERAVLDFDGLDLVAFTGATGAGKSTLIDAITFALYGSVARYGRASLVAPVIHQLANQARVRLDFEAGGRTYIATRVVRRVRRGEGGDGATTREARLELVDPDGGDTTVLAGEVRELNPAIEELLGLDFRQFTRTIVLPQGEFAAFLRDDPADRDKLLQRLLDLGIYERMGKLARSRARTAADQAEVLDQQRRQSPPPGADELDALAARVDLLAVARGRVDAELAQLREVDARLVPLRERCTEIDRAIERLAPIEPPERLAGLDRRLQAAGEQRQGAESQLAEARTIRDDALAALDDLPDRGALVRVTSLVEQLGEATAKIEQLRVTAGEVGEQAEALAVEQEAVDARAAEAEATVRAARLAADAAGWTALLEVGEPCPVCHRAVDTIPDHDAAHQLEAASDELAALERQSKSLARQLAKASGTAQASADEIERQAERVDLLQLQLSTHDGPADPAGLAAQLEAVEQAEQRYRTALAAVTELERRLDAASADEREARDELQALEADLGARRDALADLKPPTLSRRSLGDDYQLLGRWAAETAAELGRQRAELAAEGKEVARRRGELAAALADLARSVGIDLGDGFEAAAGDLPSRLADELAEARAAVATAEQRRHADELAAARIVELRASGALDDELGRHLRAGGFGSWLLAEALDNIVAKATVWLLQLSNDQYSLVAGDKSFAIIDHNNADETRDVRTLSGGETFLASLALALALADSIAELAPVDAPRLESMFLDEGFGTLDPATLDVVAGAIEELASTGRMIGIVTHVADLAERMPARFEVSKGPVTSTVELVQR